MITEEHKVKILNYFWRQIAPKMGMQLYDYSFKAERKAAYHSLLSDNGRLRVNSSTHTIYGIPCPFDDINIRLYIQNNSISNKYFSLYYYEDGSTTLYYQLWERKY